MSYFFSLGGLKIEFINYGFMVDISITDDLIKDLGDDVENLKKIFVLTLSEILMLHTATLKKMFEERGDDWKRFMNVALVHAVVRMKLFDLPIPMLDDNSIEMFSKIKEMVNQEEMPTLSPGVKKMMEKGNKQEGGVNDDETLENEPEKKRENNVSAEFINSLAGHIAGKQLDALDKIIPPLNRGANSEEPANEEPANESESNMEPVNAESEQDKPNPEEPANEEPANESEPNMEPVNAESEQDKPNSEEPEAE